MARQTTARVNRGAQQRAPYQMDLFGDGTKAGGNVPSWLHLPEHVRTALIGLMAQMIRQHALAVSGTEAANDR